MGRAVFVWKVRWGLHTADGYSGAADAKHQKATQYYRLNLKDARSERASIVGQRLGPHEQHPQTPTPLREQVSRVEPQGLSVHRLTFCLQGEMPLSPCFF